jgi:hypothetical protein
MIQKSTFVFAILFATVLLTFSASVNGITSQEARDKITNSVSKLGITGDWKAVSDKIQKLVQGNWTLIDTFSVGVKTNTSQLSDFAISLFGNVSWIPVMVNGTIVNGSSTPPQPKVEICGDGIDNDNDGLVDEGCPINPPSPDKPSIDVNTTAKIRLAVVGDIDDNSGLTTQLDLAKKYHTTCFVVPGDYAYHNGANVLNAIKNADFDCNVVDTGNHDSGIQTKEFMGMGNTYGNFTFRQVSFFLIDANMQFDCSSTQFKSVKASMEASQSWYKFAVVHQPYVTVKSQHPANGQFSCWNPLFVANSIDAVLQAHNHNYQRFDVNGMLYGVFGTGTHDTGSSMYPLNSDNWNGIKCQKCITGTNGITLIDLQIDNPNVRHMDAWFLDNSGNVKDKFN